MAPKRKPPPADSELFILDSIGSSSVRQSLSFPAASDVPQRLRKSDGKPLRSLAALYASQAQGIPAVAGRQVKQKKLLGKNDKARLEGMVTRNRRKGEGTLADVGAVNRATSVAKLPPAATSDLWGSAASSAAGPSKSLASTLPSRPPISLHRLQEVEDEEALPAAVELPDKGQSYNPSLEDHQSLLRRALDGAQAEEAKEREAREIKACLDAARSSGPVEAWQSLEPLTDTAPSPPPSSYQASDPGSVGPRSKPKRKKTLQKRKRQLLAKSEQQARLSTLLLRAQRRALHALPSIQSTLVADSSIRAAEREAKALRKSQFLKRCGLLKSNDPRTKPDFQLTEELADGLRSLKAEGNLWKDWELSARRRGKIERTLGTGKRKGRGKGSGRAKGAGYRTVEKYGWKHFERDM